MSLLLRRHVRADRRVTTLALVASVFTLSVAITASAQAHVPYVTSAWGSNLSGQLGIGSEGPEECTAYKVPCSTTPAQLDGLRGVTAMAGGEEHTLAVLEDGTVRAWGNNEADQLGDGSGGTAQPESLVPVPVAGLGSVTSVAAGAFHSLARLSDGTARSWGYDESGQLGDGIAGPNHARATPIVVTATGGSPLTGVAAVAAGEEHSLALLSNGTVDAWGNNESGQLGIGVTTWHVNRAREVVARRRPLTPLTGVIAVAAGEEHSLALLSNGTVVAWGGNSFGQLGNGSTGGPETCEAGPCSKTPVPVSGLSGVVAIAAGGYSNLALLSNGTVMGWGENAYGELGNGTTTSSAVPVQVGKLSGVSAIAAGDAHSLALLPNGTVMAWGYGGEGQLGVGSTAGLEKCGPSSEQEPCSATPLTATGLSAINVKGIAAGAWHSLAFGPLYPAITSLSPKEGSQLGGTLVTITGTELAGATAVKFGSTLATTYKVESATSIAAVAPKGTGTVDVSVTTPEGASLLSPAGRFTYWLTPPKQARTAAAQPAAQPSGTCACSNVAFAQRQIARAHRRRLPAGRRRHHHHHH